MRRHNILFTSLSGQTAGGGQISLFLLLERLNKKKFTPYLICPSHGDFLEGVNKLGVETSVIDMGSIKNPNFISSFDIVVLSTNHSEGLSRVVLEAMASSKPAIAPRIGGNPEAIKNSRTGTIIPFGDPDRLADAILELAENENKRKAMGEAGRRRAENLFSIEKNVKQIEKLYETLLCQDM